MRNEELHFGDSTFDFLKAQKESILARYPAFSPRIGCVGLVSSQLGGRILLVQRNKEPRMGQWVLPGGKIEPFESYTDTVVRELREETGLKVIPANQPFYVGQVITPAISEHRIVLYFRAVVVDWNGLKAGDDAGAVGLFWPEEVNTMAITPATREVLEHEGILETAR